MSSYLNYCTILCIFGRFLLDKAGYVVNNLTIDIRLAMFAGMIMTYLMEDQLEL